MHLSPMATLQVSFGDKKENHYHFKDWEQGNSPSRTQREEGGSLEQVCGSRVSIGGHLCSWGV